MNDALNRFIGYVIGLITMYVIMRITEGNIYKTNATYPYKSKESE